MCSLTVLEAGSLKSWCQQVTLLLGYLEESPLLAFFSFRRLSAFLSLWLHLLSASSSHRLLCVCLSQRFLSLGLVRIHVIALKAHLDTAGYAP